MKKICPAALLVFILLFVFISAVQAQSPQQALTQYISDLQKSPNDTALREKIIRHVQTMRPAPAIPTEVEKFEGRAEFAFKNAKSTKSEADFLDAAKEYEKALLIAPWVSAYYFNQGVAFEMAGKLKEAKQSFELYLLAAPNAQDARDIRKRIAGLEYAMEKAARESSPQAIAAKRQNEYEAWLEKLDGAQWRNDQVIVTSCVDNYIEMHGREIRTGWITVRPGARECHLNPRMGDGWSIYRGRVEGHNFVFTSGEGTSRGTISEDGEVIMVDFTPSASAPAIFKPSKSSYTRVKNPKWTIWNR